MGIANCHNIACLLINARRKLFHTQNRNIPLFPILHRSRPPFTWMHQQIIPLCTSRTNSASTRHLSPDRDNETVIGQVQPCSVCTFTNRQQKHLKKAPLVNASDDIIPSCVFGCGFVHSRSSHSNFRFKSSIWISSTQRAGPYKK